MSQFQIFAETWLLNPGNNAEAGTSTSIVPTQNDAMKFVIQHRVICNYTNSYNGCLFTGLDYWTDLFATKNHFYAL